jgi:hypothetical protein
MRFSGLNRLLGRAKPPAFSGWGMTSESVPPWDAAGNSIDADFARANELLLKAIHEQKFHLTQFRDVPSIDRLLQQLMWRHYFVFWSARYAAEATKQNENHFVECGVCDGLTSYFVAKGFSTSKKSTLYLYDAWEAMVETHLMPSEKTMTGAYHHLSVENTKNNLLEFQENLIFNKGYIPKSFATAKTPAEVSWLHIDLNSANATLSALEFFFNRVLPGGVILFDDYAVAGYQDTRTSVDSFFVRKPGIFLPTPTGQGLFFKV